MTAQELQEELVRRVREQGKEFIIDYENEQVIADLCHYFTDTATQNIDPDKGLFIWGGIGSGKTFLMNLLRINPKQNYKVADCAVIASEFARNGEEALDKYCQVMEFTDFTGKPKTMRSIKPYCFDDLGTENDKKHFGTDLNVMLDIMLRRYSKGEFYKTHITSNVSADQLKDKYGPRFTSRLKEMFNFINFLDAKDRRK